MTRQEYLQLIIVTCLKNPTKQQQTATASKYPQGFFHQKPCRHCGKAFTPNAPSECYCSEWCRAYCVTEAYLKRTYKITLSTYLDMAEEQGFVCAICGRDNFKLCPHHAGTLVVDHCHATGNIRVLLCHNCNRALGLLGDSRVRLRRAINYLERATTIEKAS